MFTLKLEARVMELNVDNKVVPIYASEAAGERCLVYLLDIPQQTAIPYISENGHSTLETKVWYYKKPHRAMVSLPTCRKHKLSGIVATYIHFVQKWGSVNVKQTIPSALLVRFTDTFSPLLCYSVCIPDASISSQSQSVKNQYSIQCPPGLNFQSIFQDSVGGIASFPGPHHFRLHESCLPSCNRKFAGLGMRLLVAHCISALMGILFSLEIGHSQTIYDSCDVFDSVIQNGDYGRTFDLSK